MTSVTIQIEGIDQVMDKITSISQLEDFGYTLLSVAEYTKGKVAKYPRFTEANSPSNPRGRWYERGYGPKWARKDGSVGGRKTSEALGRRWTVQMRDAGRTLVIGNNVSYGPYVQDEEHQAAIHKQNGWITIQQAAKDAEPMVQKKVEEYLRKKLG